MSIKHARPQQALALGVFNLTYEYPLLKWFSSYIKLQLQFK